MSSYSSTHRQYQQYIPEVNAELYANLLQKQEVDYQRGVQKIDQTLDYVASLPVSNPVEKEYLQGKISAITSELNQNINTNWGDQAMQKMTSKHITAIANDPNVQAAMYNSSVIKKGFADMNDDTDVSKGKNLINKQAFLDHYNQWYGGAELGKRFDQQYFSYQDVIGDFDKYYKDKKPNARIQIKYAGVSQDPATGKISSSPQLAAQEWDATTMKWKELGADEVSRDFQNFIGANPQYQKQIELNADYTYRNLGPEDFVRNQNEVFSKSLEINKRLLQEGEAQLASMQSDQPGREELQTQLKGLRDSIIPEIESKLSSKGQYERLLLWQMNPELAAQAKRTLYMQQLNNTVIGKHAFREDEAVQLIGLSPTEKMYKERDYDLKLRADVRAEKDLDLKFKREERMIAAAEAKQKQEFSQSAIPLEGALPDKEPWEAFNDQYKNMQSSILNSETEYIYNWLSDNSEFSGKFDFSPDGKPLIKGQYSEEVFRMYEQRKQQYLQGNTENMDKADLDHFQSVVQQEKLAEAIRSKIQETRSNAAAKIGENPEYNKALQEYNTVTKNYDQRTVDKVQRAIDFAMAGSNAKPESYGFANQTEAIKAMSEANSNVWFSDNDNKSLADAYKKLKGSVQDQEKQFYNNYVKSNNFVTNDVFVPFVNPRTNKQDDWVLQQVNAVIPEGQSSKLLERTSGDKKTTVTVGYTQDSSTGDYFFVLKGNNGEVEKYRVDPTTAQGYRFQNLSNQSNLEQFMKINTNRGNTGSKTWVNNESFEEAVPLSNDGVNELRYQVKRVGGAYYVKFWKKEPGQSPTFMRNPKTGKVLEFTASDIRDVERKLTNFNTTGSTDAPASYYPADQNNEQSYQETPSTEE